MKKIILAACILIFPNLLTYGQIHETWGDLLFEDTLSMNPLNEWITIPFPDENGWQTGELYKDFFDSTLSENHFIITDTLNSYPAAADFYFELTLPYWDSSWGEGILSFYHIYQTDSSCDGGFIEVYNYDEGIWENIISATYPLETRCIGLYDPDDTIIGSIPAFTGTSDGWTYVEIYWFWLGLTKKSEPGQTGASQRIRFRFKSDAVNTGKDGWLIDQMVFRGYSVKGSVDHYPAAEIFVFPNPAPDYINIYIPHNIGCDRISIFNTQGQVVLQKEIYSSETLDLSALTEGIYHYCLYHAESLIKAGSFVKK